MKKILILLIAILRCSFSLYGQYVIEESPLVVSINKDVLANCKDTIHPCGYIPIKRMSKQQVIILLPLNGTSSSALLYKAEDYKKYKNNNILSGLDKRSDEKFLGQGQPLTLNLTDLIDGEYVTIYRTGECFAIIRIALSTK